MLLCVWLVHQLAHPVIHTTNALGKDRRDIGGDSETSMGILLGEFQKIFPHPRTRNHISFGNDTGGMWCRANEGHFAKDVPGFQPGQNPVSAVAKASADDAGPLQDNPQRLYTLAFGENLITGGKSFLDNAVPDSGSFFRREPAEDMQRVQLRNLVIHSVTLSSDSDARAFPDDGIMGKVSDYSRNDDLGRESIEDSE